MKLDFKLLKLLLLLDREVVGVRFYFEGDELTPEGRRPEKPLYFCSAVSLASKGKSFLLTENDLKCSASVRNLCISKNGTLKKDLVSEYISYGTYENEAASASILLETAKVLSDFGLKTGGKKVAVVEVFPAQENDADIYVFVGKPKAMMRIVQGYAFKHGQLNGVSFSGMHGMCFETAFRAFSKKEPVFSLLCSGARHFGMFSDEEMSCAIPKEFISDIFEGVVKTAEACEDDSSKQKILNRAKEEGLEIKLTPRKSYIYEE